MRYLCYSKLKNSAHLRGWLRESAWVKYLVCVKYQFMAAFVTVAFIMMVKEKSLEKEVSSLCSLYNCISSL